MLRVYRNQLAEILHEFNHLNSAYAHSMNAENRTEEDSWQTEVDTRANESFVLIETHQLIRKDEESTASVASDHSFRYPSNERKHTNPKQQSTQITTRACDTVAMATNNDPIAERRRRNSILDNDLTA